MEADMKARANTIELPQSGECEKGVLSSILVSNGAVVSECEDRGLSPACFYVPAHRTIYTLLIDLCNAEQPIDLIALTQALRDRGLLDQVGGPGFVTELQTFPAVAANVAHYIDSVREKYILRETSAAAAQAIRQTNEAQAEPLSVLSELESRVVSIRSLCGRNGTADGLTVLTPDEILALPRDEHSCLLGDRLLTKSQSLVVAGQAGIGKSRLALQMAVACITKRHWCGIETHAPDLRWLVLQTENGLPRLQGDLSALRKWAGDFDQDKLHIQVIQKDSDAFLCLGDSAVVAQIEATIRRVQPDGVIADPLRDFGIGDLNSDADMIATLRELARIVRRGNPDRAIVLLHHALTGKAGAAKAFGLERGGFARNSKALLGWTRGQINVIPGAEENNEQLVLTCGKNSNGKEFSPIAIRLDPETMIYEPDESFDIDEWRQTVSATTSNVRKGPQILRDLLEPDRKYDKKQIVAIIMDEKGIGKTRAYELVEQAKDRGILSFNKIIKTYALA
jgi:hypothetical protein